MQLKMKIRKGMKRMNWFDLLLLGIVAVSVIGGLIQGVLKQLFNLFGFFIVFALAFLGSPYLSGYTADLLQPEYFIPYEEVMQRYGISLPLEKIIQLAGAVLAFLFLLVVLMIIFRLLLRGLTAVNKIPVVGFFNRLGGALLGLLIALLINIVIINAATLLPLSFVDDAVNGSLLAGYLKLYLPPLFTGFKEILVDYLLRGQAGSGT